MTKGVETLVREYVEEEDSDTSAEKPVRRTVSLRLEAFAIRHDAVSEPPTDLVTFGGQALRIAVAGDTVSVTIAGVGLVLRGSLGEARDLASALLAARAPTTTGR